ncbi:hypothetical protein K402DRAFT_7252 [Aulographum hederae CBS 113979]|uniref:Uncharacterized protein n=1 Tax=Aulographum hederae CBS 113979 TaxID=1176131 RepID=A0A6G1HHE2_9PEZI|nr:hypothetical protein K402DRAFT_7252 [Aulographum hederae CBS 113979]
MLALRDFFLPVSVVRITTVSGLLSRILYLVSCSSNFDFENAWETPELCATTAITSVACGGALSILYLITVSKVWGSGMKENEGLTFAITKKFDDNSETALINALSPRSLDLHRLSSFPMLEQIRGECVLRRAASVCCVKAVADVRSR